MSDPDGSPFRGDHSGYQHVCGGCGGTLERVGETDRPPYALLQVENWFGPAHPMSIGIPLCGLCIESIHDRVLESSLQAEEIAAESNPNNFDEDGEPRDEAVRDFWRGRRGGPADSDSPGGGRQ